MEQILKRLANLLSVKSLVTLVLSIMFAILSYKGVITGEQFLTIFSVIIAFYFGQQSQKVQELLDKKSE